MGERGYRFKRSETGWFQIICELNKCKLSAQEQTKRIGVPYPTLIGWKLHEAESKHCDGEQLIKLWCSVTNKSRNELPKIDNKGARHG